eukprot:snap_masked-scaffold_2-processed-gene-15.19-mRNA-1 protein AED:1.00 eAED:1.00 QI:0/0/0/0/1/1/3/0/89
MNLKLKSNIRSLILYVARKKRLANPYASINNIIFYLLLISEERNRDTTNLYHIFTHNFNGFGSGVSPFALLPVGVRQHNDIASTNSFIN